MNRHLKRIVKKDARKHRRMKIINAFKVYAKAYAKAFWEHHTITAAFRNAIVDAIVYGRSVTHLAKRADGKIHYQNLNPFTTVE